MRAYLVLAGLMAVFAPALVPTLALSGGLDDSHWLEAEATTIAPLRFDRSSFADLAEAVAAVSPTLPEDMPSETACLAQAVYFEARSEPLDGQLAVAQVVLNRLQSRYWPDTICSVVFQNERWRHRCQFSFACDGLSDNPRNPQAWRTARAISTLALTGIWEDVTDTATHYHADYVSPYWREALEQTTQHGRHLFYRHAAAD